MDDAQFNRVFDAAAAALALVLTIVLWPFLEAVLEVGRAVLALGAVAAGG